MQRVVSCLLLICYCPFDESSKANRELTYKVYHHLYDPSGQRLVTNGSGGQFIHHRGLFFGFNQVSYGYRIWLQAGEMTSADVAAQGANFVELPAIQVRWK